MVLFLVPVLALGELTVGQGKKLDEILVKTGKIREEGVKGFIIRNESAPQSLPLKALPRFSFDTSRTAKSIVTYGRYVSYETYLTDMITLSNKINALQIEYAASSEKMTTILDNMATNSGTQKDSLDMLIKFMEAISAILAAIGGLVGFWHMVWKKRKKNYVTTTTGQQG